MMISNFIDSPYLGENNYKTLVFSDNFFLSAPNKLILSSQASKGLIIDNAGGASEYSESMSIHYFENVFNASDIILEKEVKYWSDLKMVDYICTVNKTKIGVSVTRAMGFPCSSRFTRADGVQLLRRKINGLIVACDLVITEHSFNKSILHIWCQNQRIADIMREVYEQELQIDSMGLKVLCDVAVIISICNNKNIYTNNTEYKNRILRMDK